MQVDYLILGSFLVGILGNTVALTILCSPCRPRNSKHVLLLRCLAINDLISLVGMLTWKMLKTHKAIPEYYICVLVVILRAFGLGSGCVALVMAVERWLALTRPFFYQQKVTYQLILKSILFLWMNAVFITYLPLANFGAFYKEVNGTIACCRFRDATSTKDIVYAYLFFTVGTSLCVCICIFNINVFWQLARLGNPRAKLLRRISKTMINSIKPQYSTTEEINFAKLMALLCVIFVVSWMPDMICVPWAQIQRKSKVYENFGKIGNVLKLIYFTIDPYIYVIYQYVSRRKITINKRNGRPMLKMNTGQGNSAESTPTSILLQQPSFTTSSTYVALHYNDNRPFTPFKLLIPTENKRLYCSMLVPNVTQLEARKWKV